MKYLYIRIIKYNKNNKLHYITLNYKNKIIKQLNNKKF